MVPTLGRYDPTNPFRFFNYWLYIFGRLEPRVTLEQAGAQLNTYCSRVAHPGPARSRFARRSAQRAFGWSSNCFANRSC